MLRRDGVFHGGFCVSSLGVDLLYTRCSLRTFIFHILKKEQIQQTKARVDAKPSKEMTFGLFTMKDTKPAVCPILFHVLLLIWSAIVFPHKV